MSAGQGAQVNRKKDSAPTINDVARLAGVSKKTVSRVINRSPLLNQTTREKVEAVIADLSYVPNPQARALALRRNFLIGLIHDNPNAQMILNFQEGVLETIRTRNSRWWCGRSTDIRRACWTMCAPSWSANDSMACCSFRQFRRMTSLPRSAGS